MSLIEGGSGGLAVLEEERTQGYLEVVGGGIVGIFGVLDAFAGLVRKRIKQTRTRTQLKLLPCPKHRRLRLAAPGWRDHQRRSFVDQPRQ